MRKVYRGRLNILSIFAWIIISLNLLLGVSCASLTSNEEQYVHPSQSLSMNPLEIKTMAWQDEDYLWIGNRAGVARIDRDSGSTEIFDDIACPRLFVTSSNIWCSTVNYINKYNGKTWQRFDLPAYQVIEVNDGTVLAGTTEGLARFESEKQDWEYLINVGDSTSSKFIFKTGSGIQLSFQSHDDALWFYSYNEDYLGVTRWTETSHSSWLPVGDYVMVQPLLETRNGIIWAAGDDGAVSRWDGLRWQTWYPFRLKPTIVDIIESQSGDIWVLANADGVGRWNGQTWQIWSRDEDILQNCPGTSLGRKCFSAEANAEYFPANGLGKNQQSRLALTTILELQDHIWVGTAQEGISRWDGNEWRNYTTVDGLSSESIAVLTENPDGSLWVGIFGGGSITMIQTQTDGNRFPD